MKQWKRMPVVCALLALLLVVCIPVFSAASAAGEGTIEVSISGTEPCYAENGKQIGRLNPVDNAPPTYQADKSEETVAVVVLYLYTAADGGLGSDKLEGKVRVSLWPAQQTASAPADVPDANAAAPDPNADPTPGATAAPQPELPAEVWVDASLVIMAHNRAKIQDAATMEDLRAQIAALQQQNEATEIGGTPLPITQETVASPSAGEEEKAGLETPILPIIACATGVLMLGGVVWLAVSASRAERCIRRTGSEQNQTNRQLADMAISLGELSKKPDPGMAIGSALTDAKTKEPYLKTLVPVLEEVRLQIDRIHSKIIDPPPPPHPPDKISDALALVKSLAGVASREDWTNIIQRQGYRYVLVQTSATNREALQEDQTGNSILACLMRSVESEEAYLVPSFEDPNAGESRWKDFYTVTDDPAEKHYRIDELTVMKVINRAFFTLASKGKLVRRP
ncbi:MAG: hypothetical protein VB062_01095 [Christensenella sp.]|nr:hypothetical protein [Christensenella sp.]